MTQFGNQMCRRCTIIWADIRAIAIPQIEGKTGMPLSGDTITMARSSKTALNDTPSSEPTTSPMLVVLPERPSPTLKRIERIAPRSDPHPHLGLSAGE